jgi:replicative DNA helicase
MSDHNPNPTRPLYSIEAEQSVLGALLLDNGAWDSVADTIVVEDFAREEHRAIFTALAVLINSSKLADVITVYENLQNGGWAERCSLEYLNALAQSVPGAAGLRRYAEIVRERALLRQLAHINASIGEAVYAANGKTVHQLLDDAEGQIFALGEKGSRAQRGFQGMDTLAVQLIDRVTELAENGCVDVSGLRTGFYDLDKATAGLQPGDLIILAGRPSMGKTAFSLNIAENVSANLGLPVVVFSMEMGAAQLTLRLVGSHGRIDQQLLRTGALKDDDWVRLCESVEVISKSPLFIDETPALTMVELRARARRQARICGKLGLIVIDYLQLMSGGGSGENRATEIGEISRGLKALAKELGCPIIALSQLNRSVETRSDKRPMMSDLRESGSIEQDADLIMMMYRDDYYNKDTKEPGVTEIIIAKQRNGPTGTTRLGFMKQCTRFENLAPQSSDPR